MTCEGVRLSALVTGTYSIKNICLVIPNVLTQKQQQQKKKKPPKNKTKLETQKKKGKSGQINIQVILSISFSRVLADIFEAIFNNAIRTHNHLVRKRTLNGYGWMFVHKLIGCEFESRCCHFNFIYRACFEKSFLWHSGNYRV